jgi:Ni/Fe-hydrogenase 1 B-type cytochrome subunit
MSAPVIASPEAEVPAPVYVFELPVRIWHWVNAACIVVLAGTGFLIGHPLWPQLSGEPYNLFVMGWVRTIHFSAAYIFAVGFLVRLYWAFVGNKHAREIFIPRVWSLHWWRDMGGMLAWYALARKTSPREVGHNPLAQLVMFVMFVLASVFQIVTGFALYGEGAGGWSQALFTSWVIPLFGGSMQVHTWHHLCMWYIVLFVIIHVYIALRENVLAGQTTVSTMIDGWRRYKDNRP